VGRQTYTIALGQADENSSPTTAPVDL